MSQVNVVLSEDLVKVAHLDQGNVSQEAAKLIALELLREQKLSVGRAAELCGVPLASFMDYAAAHEVPPLNYGFADLEHNCQTIVRSSINFAGDRLMHPYSSRSMYHRHAIANSRGGSTSTFVCSRTSNASSILIARSKVIPKYSLRSSRETCDSWTARRFASSRWDKPLAIRSEMSRWPSPRRFSSSSNSPRFRRS